MSAEGGGRATVALVDVVVQIVGNTWLLIISLKEGHRCRRHAPLSLAARSRNGDVQRSVGGQGRESVRVADRRRQWLLMKAPFG